MNGTLHAGEGRFVLRFARRFAHPPEKVWAALTDPAELSHWFPQDVEADLRPGGTMRFTFRGAEAPPFNGEVLVYDPPRVFAYRWGPDVLRWELRPDGSGCTLTFTDTIETQGKAARDGAVARLPGGAGRAAGRGRAPGRQPLEAGPSRLRRAVRPRSRDDRAAGLGLGTATRVQKQAPGCPEVANPLRLSAVGGKLPVGQLKGTRS